MGAVTERIRFVTFVVKLPIRHPVLVAKQATSTAVLTGNRLVLGVGTSPWREDYEMLGVPWEGRGQRMDEAVAIVRGLSAGGYFEHHGEVFDVPPIKIAPVPTEPIPILVGGHGEAALRRAARRRRRLAPRRGRPRGPARAAAAARRAPRRGGDADAALRGPRDLHGRLQRRRGAAPGGAGGDRRHRRLPLALRGGAGHRAALGQDRQAPLVRRHGDQKTR